MSQSLELNSEGRGRSPYRLNGRVLGEGNYLVSFPEVTE